MGGPFGALLSIILVVLAVSVAVVMVIYIVVPVLKGFGWLIAHIFRFIGGVIGDVLRAIGAVFASVVLIPLVVLNVVIGRWSAASHYGRAVQGELGMIGRCVYGVCIGRPARLLGLGALVEGVEKRIPEAMAKAPGADKPSKRTGQFDGYKIVGSLPGGGSGAKLYIADPDEMKLAAFARSGVPDVDQVIIKSFSLHDGSTLPQIIRESRALEAAKNIGLVLEHELNDQRFFYVMPYVPGDDLSVVTQRLHRDSGSGGLDDRHLRAGLEHVADLVRTLDRYHRGGLWHKDVKPDNIIVHDGRAHLVDLGLVTPLRSAMTLTTHGTEYFRDPEMVRMALKGVKVHEVEGAKFDIYAAGAVLFSVIENSFPAHGGLSQVSKRCPEAARWIIRRAMSDYRTRYGSTAEMRADLEAVLKAEDPFAVKPADLPSFKGGAPELAPVEPTPAPAPAAAAAVEAATPPDDRDDAGFDAASVAAAAPEAPGEAPKSPPGARRRPRLRVTNWWTGRYAGDQAGRRGGPRANHGVDGDDVRVYGAAFGAGRNMRAEVDKAAKWATDFARGFGGQEAQVAHVRHSPRPPRGAAGRSAKEQRASAQARAAAARKRASQRMHRRGRYQSGPNAGVWVSVLVVFGVLGAHFVRQSDWLESRFDQVREGLTITIDDDDHKHDGDAGASAWARTEADAASGAFVVLDDLHHADPSLRERVLERLAQVRERGFEIIGLDASSDEEDYLAKARKALGPPPAAPQDPEFVASARNWLEEQPHRVKGVIRLMWRETPEGRQPQIDLVTTRHLDETWLRRQLARDEKNGA